MLWASWLVNRPNLFFMKNKFFTRLNGSQGPKSIGAVLRDYLRSNEPLAVGYSRYLAAKKKGGNYGNK